MLKFTHLHVHSHYSLLDGLPKIGELVDFVVDFGEGDTPTSVLRFAGIPQHQATIATYGYNFELARKAALELAYEQEVFCEIVVFSKLSSSRLNSSTPCASSTRATFSRRK